VFEVDTEAAPLVDSAVLADSVVAPTARTAALLLVVLDPERIALLVVSDVGVAEATALCPT